MTVVLGGPSSGGGPVDPPVADPRTDLGGAGRRPPCTPVEGPPRIASRPAYGAFTVSSSRGSIALQGTGEALVGGVGLGAVKRITNRMSPLGLDGRVRNRRRPVIRS